MRIILTLTLYCLFPASLLLAQQPNASSRTRPADSSNAQGTVLGTKPEGVLDIVKVKGIVTKVDLEKRSVTIESSKDEEPIELTFPQPQGREQIKTSKKTAKLLGKKKLLLEELTVGSRVQLQYYSMLEQVADLVVDELKS